MNLYQEIHEQPGVIQRLLSTQRSHTERIAAAIRDDSLDPLAYATGFIARFQEKVTRHIRQFQPRAAA